MDWIFSIRLTGDINIAGRRNGKIQPQDIHPATAGLQSFEFGIRTLRGFRYSGIGGLSEYEPMLKIFAIYFKFSTLLEYNRTDLIITPFMEKFNLKLKKKQDSVCF